MGLLMVFIIWPSIVDIKSLNQSIEDQQTQLEQLYQKGRNVKKTLEQYREVKPAVTSLDSIYVKRGDELKLITTLEQTAKSQGITQDINQASGSNQAQGDKLQLQLQVTGSLHQLIAYLTALEALDYYVNIDLVRIGTAPTTSKQPLTSGSKLSAVFLATSYFKP